MTVRLTNVKTGKERNFRDDQLEEILVYLALGNTASQEAKWAMVARAELAKGKTVHAGLFDIDLVQEAV